MADIGRCDEGGYRPRLARRRPPLAAYQANVPRLEEGDIKKMKQSVDELD